MSIEAVKTIEQVKENYSLFVYEEVHSKRSFYKEDTIFDKHLSKNWNRKRVEMENEGVRIYNEKFEKGYFKGLVSFDEDMVKALMTEFSFNENQANLIYSQVVDDYCEQGFMEIMNRAKEQALFVKVVTNLGNN